MITLTNSFTHNTNVGLGEAKSLRMWALAPVGGGDKHILPVITTHVTSPEVNVWAVVWR